MKDYVDLINSGAYSADEVIRLFYNSFDDDILKEHTSDELEIAGKKFLMFARQRNVDEIVSIIDDGTDLLAITNPANIPQFSSIEAVEKILRGKRCTERKKGVCPLEAGMGFLKSILRPAGRAFCLDCPRRARRRRISPSAEGDQGLCPGPAIF